MCWRCLCIVNYHKEEEFITNPIPFIAYFYEVCELRLIKSWDEVKLGDKFIIKEINFDGDFEEYKKKLFIEYKSSMQSLLGLKA